MFTAAAAAAGDLLQDHVGLWDWRRRAAELYAEIRAFHDPELAWRLWRATRDELFRAHPQSPLDSHRRRGFAGLALFDYDPAFRCLVDLAPAPDADRHDLSGGRDGYVQLIPFARTDGLNERLGRELTLYWLGGYGGGVFLPFATPPPAGRLSAAVATCSMASKALTSAWMPTAGRSSTSTSPTTPPAPTPRAGSARLRHRRMSCRSRSPPASACRPELASAQRGSRRAPRTDRERRSRPLRCPALFGENGVRRG